MKQLVLAATLLVWVSLHPALAQAVQSTQAQAMPVSMSATANPSLYTNLGEKAGIYQLMSDFVDRVLKDERIGAHFKDAKPDQLKTRLTEQVCRLSGGPCEYQGADMKSVHAEMDISRANFNALVEVLQVSMDAQGIAFTQQRRLLALLAPMHRDIITVH